MRWIVALERRFLRRAPAARQTNRPRPGYRPRIECLEERVVPSQASIPLPSGDQNFADFSTRNDGQVVLNDQGQVAGTASGPNGPQAFVWTAAQGTQLITGLSSAGVLVLGENNQGQVLLAGTQQYGQSLTGELKLWDPKAGLVSVPLPSGDQNFADFSTRNDGQAVLNDQGQVAGTASGPNGPQAFTWTATQGTQLITGLSSAGVLVLGENNQGQVLLAGTQQYGQSLTGELQLWGSKAGLVSVPLPSGDQNFADFSTRNDGQVVLNDQGQVAGTASGPNGPQAFTWTATQGTQLITGLSSAGVLVLGENNQGQVLLAGTQQYGQSLTGELVLSTPSIQWTGKGTDDRWSDAANWSTNGVPGTGANVEFPAGVTQTSTDDDLGYAFGSITVGADYTIRGGDLTVTNGITVNQGTFTIANATTINGDTEVQAGATLAVESTGALTVAGTLTISGSLDVSGTLTIDAGASLTDNGDVKFEGGRGAGIMSTVTVAGQFTVGSGVTLDSRGNLTVAATGTLTVDGTLTAELVGSLDVEGELVASAGGVVDDFGPLTVGQDGTLTVEGSVTIEPGATLDLQGTLDVAAHGTLDSQGAVTIADKATADVSGTLTVEPLTSLDVSGTLTVQAGGKLDVLGTVTVKSGGTLGDEGTVTLELVGGGKGTGLLIDEGTVNIEAGAMLDDQDSGTLGVAKGATLTVAGTLTADSYAVIDVAGTATLEKGGTWDNQNTVTVKAGGTLTDDGTLSFAAAAVLTESGTVNVGDGASLDVQHTLTVGYGGTLDTQGAVTLGKNSNLVVEDQLVVEQGGSLEIAGAATVQLGATLDDQGDVTVKDTGDLEDQGQLLVQKPASLDDQGTLTVQGTTVNGVPLVALDDKGSLSVAAGARLYLQGLTLVEQGADLDDTGTVTVTAAQLQLAGTLTVEPQAILDVKGGVEVVGAGNLDDKGALIVETGGTLSDQDAVTVEAGATADVKGTWTEGTGGVLTGNGAITVESGGSLSVAGSFTVTSGGSLDVAGTVYVQPGGSYQPQGSVTVESGGAVKYVPGVSKVSPSAGTLAGGTTLVITGVNLGGATAVYVGGTAATINDDTDGQITVTTPAATTAGTVDVTVVTAGGTSATSTADQFTYLAATFSGLNAPVIVYGTAGVTITGQLRSNSASFPVPDGETVRVTLAGVAQNATLDSGGNFAATFDTSTLGAAAQPYPVTLHYAGDADFVAADGATTLTVNQAPTAVTLQVSTSVSVANQAIQLTATVAQSGAGAGTPGGTVTFLDGTTVLQSVSLHDGQASLPVTFPTLRPHALIARYDGDPNFSGNVSTAVVLPATTTTLTAGSKAIVYGQPLVLRATVGLTEAEKGAKLAGTVDFYAGGMPLGSAPLKGGGAVLITSPTSAPPVGTDALTAVYRDGGPFGTSTSAAVNVTVSAARTQLRLAAPGSAVIGQTVTLTARVAALGPSKAPVAGEVTFLDGGLPLGKATVVNGVAVLQVALTTPGKHALTAQFAGTTANLLGSSSATVSVAVKSAATRLVLGVVPDPAGADTTVTLTAQVSVVAPGEATPAGKVTFKDGKTTLGTANVVNGVATLKLATLGKGKHTLMASYADATGLTIASISRTVTEVID
jgi:hypothetical protein